MAEFDSHKWTREFKEAQVDKANLGEDYSTMRLKSNIAQKWRSDKDMVSDLRQWFEATALAGGYDLADDIVSALEIEARYARNYLKINSRAIRNRGR